MNSNKHLQSHYDPDLRLEEHIDQVRAAASFLLAAHSPMVRNRRPETPAVLDALVRGHDLGKGSPAFQTYIRNPAGYRGDAHSKEHSALSAALAILWAGKQGWEPLRVLALAQAVAGHHGGFAALDRLEDRLLLDDGDALAQQWAGLDRAALAAATGLDLAGLGDEFEDGRRWLFRRQQVKERLEALPVADAVQFRLWTQFLFSILLEADKAFLALRAERLDDYLNAERRPLPPDLIDRRLAGLPETPLNPLRQRIRAGMLERLQNDHPCLTLTLPTGIGKTLLAASWALQQRERMQAAADGIPPKIIVVLPFLSIIDQTEQEYRRLFGLDPADAVQSDWLMASHSLTQMEYELEGRRLGDRYTEFFLNTWRSEVILTTFDQLLLALFSDRGRHLMRFHSLMDALIILDEVQALPCGLWDLVDTALRALTVEGNSRVLMMSATQPALLTGARELAGDAEQVAAIFAVLRRYRIRFRQRDEQDLETFIAALYLRLDGWLSCGKRVLITLNTRAAARAVWRAVTEHIDDESAWPVYLISADVTPQDRLKKIAAVKSGRPCVVVSTQTVEAGVDIDMDVTLRDFAPLDSLIQVAGRCNRNNRLGEYGGAVEIVALRSEQGRRFAGMVYDPVLLDCTHAVLAGLESVGEEDVLALSRRYFELLKERKDQGRALTRQFARWEEMENIHLLLRGAQRQESLLVLRAGDEALRRRIERALAVADRWERRTALRALAGEIQRRTVSVYARRDFHPEDYAETLGPFWILHDGFYTPEGGLDLQLSEDNPVCIF